VPVVASTRIDEEDCMTVIIGIDPHKATHTAVAIDGDERSLGEFEVRAQRNQTQRLLAWAVPFPDRRWAIESADGLGKLLAQQLLAAGEDVVDVPPTLAARVRLLGSVKAGKNDGNDALSTAIAGLRHCGLRAVRVNDHATVCLRRTAVLSGPRLAVRSRRLRSRRVLTLGARRASIRRGERQKRREVRGESGFGQGAE
jgi:hypothetical protein